LARQYHHQVTHTLARTTYSSSGIDIQHHSHHPSQTRQHIRTSSQFIPQSSPHNPTSARHPSTRQTPPNHLAKPPPYLPTYLPTSSTSQQPQNSHHQSSTSTQHNTTTVPLTRTYFGLLQLTTRLRGNSSHSASHFSPQLRHTHTQKTLHPIKSTSGWRHFTQRPFKHACVSLLGDSRKCTLCFPATGDADNPLSEARESGQPSSSIHEATPTRPIVSIQKHRAHRDGKTSDRLGHQRIVHIIFSLVPSIGSFC
jgi:hypothetical protein